MRFGKFLPTQLRLTDTRTGRVYWTDMGGANGATAAFLDNRILASAWSRQEGGTNQLTLLLQDVTRAVPEQRHVIEIPTDLRFIHVERGHGCALIKAFSSGRSMSKPGRWYIANSKGLLALELEASEPADAFWLGGRRTFVFGRRDPTGALVPAGSVDCQGQVGPAEPAALPLGRLDTTKSSLSRNLVVVGANDHKWDSPPERQVMFGDVTVIRLHGVLDQDFAVSADGQMFAVDRLGTTIVYLSRDLKPIATLADVDSDRSFWFAADGAAILFNDDEGKLQRRPIPATVEVEGTTGL